MQEITGSKWTNYDNMNLSKELRRLWAEHVFWTRLFIVSALAGLPDLAVTTERLLRNPADFANVFRKFYGSQTADAVQRLLEDHLKIAADLVNSAIRQDAEAVEQNTKLWYSNADKIASALGRINPVWTAAQWRDLLYDHLRMTTDEVLARLSGDYAKDAAIFDMILEQALDMADVMAEGIAKQFEI